MTENALPQELSIERVTPPQSVQTYQEWRRIFLEKTERLTEKIRTTFPEERFMTSTTTKEGNAYSRDVYQGAYTVKTTRLHPLQRFRKHAASIIDGLDRICGKTILSIEENNAFGMLVNTRVEVQDTYRTPVKEWSKEENYRATIKVYVSL